MFLRVKHSGGRPAVREKMRVNNPHFSPNPRLPTRLVKFCNDVTGFCVSSPVTYAQGDSRKMADEEKVETGSKENLTRAQLRRRKILESSEDRLAKLSGKSNGTQRKPENEDSGTTLSSGSEVISEESACKESEASLAGFETRFMEDTDVPGSQEEDWKTPDEQFQESEQKESSKERPFTTDESAKKDWEEHDDGRAGWETRFMEDIDVPGSQEEDWVDPQEQEQVQVRMSKMSTNILRLVIHVVMAAFVNVLIVYNMEYVFRGVILYPFAVVEFIMWCLEFGFKKESTLTSSVLMMCGIPPATVRTHTNLVGALSTCFSDFCVYFFTFVVVRSLYENVF